MKNQSAHIDVVFEPSTAEFVTAAAGYCAYLEHVPSQGRVEFAESMLRLLSLVYLKATLLPAAVAMDDADLPAYVSEQDYEQVRTAVANLMGEADDYLEVFAPDMIYGDDPMACTISETLADIYQALADFVGAFRSGVHLTMNDAVAACRDQFETSWGQRVVNVLRPLHELRYNAPYDDETPAK